MENKLFNAEIKNRTNGLFIEIYKLSREKQTDYLEQLLLKQLIRSSSSVSANWRAAILSRSKNEFYSKICVVVEECDETIHWLETLSSINFFSEKQIFRSKQDYEELLRIFLSIRNKLRS